MENRLDTIFRQWLEAGGDAFLSDVKPVPAISIEQLIAESTALCKYSGRLTWIVLDWLIKHSNELNLNKLLELTGQKGESAVLGLLADAAFEVTKKDFFKCITAMCKPAEKKDFFFSRVKESPLASKLTLQNPLPIFLKWNFYSNELRYLSSNVRTGILSN